VKAVVDFYRTRRYCDGKVCWLVHSLVCSLVVISIKLGTDVECLFYLDLYVM